jgi:AAA+ ATPase superfamily predicted ATPase
MKKNSEKIFAGRQEECSILQELLEHSRAELVAVLGRRRIGKTYLVKQVYASHLCFHFTGIKDADRKTMLTEFAEKIAANTPRKKNNTVPKNWMEAFRLLKQYLLSLQTKKKKVIFLDEFPWIDGHKSGFLPAFEYFWNDWASEQNIIIVVCGSSSSWMLKNVLNNKAGLHNRITKYINLAPFTLKETKELLVAKGIHLPHYEIIQLYMAIGGVPYYLNEVRKGESATQSIDRILFGEKSSLKREFQNLYRALFDHYEKYETIIKALSLKRKGLTREEIIAATGIPNGGSLTRMLTELEESSFIKSFQPFGKEKKEMLYRLVDEYSIFYYQFNPQKNPAGSFIKISSTAKYKSWAGFAFESLCIRHTNRIKKALGIAGIFSQESSWYFKGTQQQPGFQIDMLIDRSDNSINICEMKFYATEFELSKKEADELRTRREFFRTKTQTKKYLINTLVTTYGLQKNEPSAGVIDKVVVSDSFF